MAKALIVVDVQNDFVEGGSLAVAGGKQVAIDIADYLAFHEQKYALVVFSRDYHNPDDTNDGHFADEPDFVNTWPVHCVAKSIGSDIAAPLGGDPSVEYSIVAESAIVVYKGQGAPAYSAFEGVGNFLGDETQTLSEILYGKDIDAVDICGIATDYCVKATALDANKYGFKPTLLLHLTAAVGGEDAKQEVARELSAQGITVVTE